MATNGSDTLAGYWLEDDPRPHRPEPATAAPDMERPRGTASGGLNGTAELALAPLVDKIAYGLARGLVVAFKELENYIAGETRKVGEAVGRRLDTLTAALQEADARQAAELAAHKQESARRIEGVQTNVRDLADVVSEQQKVSVTVQEKVASTATSLQESNTRIDLLAKELGIHQEDIAALKSAVSGFSSRADAVMERLDRQADALRSLYATYSQRETELQQLVDGLARLRAYPAPSATSGL